jgi:hypothetical protein
MHELSYLVDTKFSLYFDHRGGPYQKKSKIFFHPDMTIHFFGVKSGPKNPKNSVKYVFLKDVLKNHVFDLKSVKIVRF